jgi:hypothetical protein
MSGQAGAAFAAALFLVLAMSAAGIVHVVWLRSAAAQRFTQPIDMGRTFRARRVFGENKMLRGFLIMPPAASITFALLGAAREHFPAWLAQGIWALQPAQFAVLGFACGLAFMAAELPNSFVKRQLDVVPGQPPSAPPLRALFFVIDRCDSVLGVLIVASLLVPIHALTWLWVLLLGPCLHALFSILLHRLGVKARAL